jgi:hypothetical protein
MYGVFSKELNVTEEAELYNEVQDSRIQGFKDSSEPKQQAHTPLLAPKP